MKEYILKYHQADVENAPEKEFRTTSKSHLLKKLNFSRMVIHG
ncbi:hypothetical protein [Caulobacter phage Cr30]|nr:hypothetical protein OZ74_gp090 [Caulobacter phage Cr30]AGS80975.1 hypothetical protein [Caulobacter phage Cr30]